jgi:hypothetical protein
MAKCTATSGDWMEAQASTKATKTLMDIYGNLPILSHCQPAMHIVCTFIRREMI